MRVLLPEPRGFCAGVEMAIECLDRAIELFGTPVYAYHQIVHNTHVVRDFESRGVVFVDDVGEIPRGSTVVFSAHGISPGVRRDSEARGLRIVDATCPLVAKVHAEARRFARRGYTIVLIGHTGHDETVGVIGEAPESFVLVDSVEDVAKLSVPDGRPLAYLTQTTLSVTETAAIVQALEERFPGIEGPPTEDICYATENRQRAVRELSGESDLVLVIGSGNSSNTKRLVETARGEGVQAHRIDGPESIRLEWLAGVRTVVVTAGASVPEALVRRVVALLDARGEISVETRRIVEETLTFRVPLPVRRKDVERSDVVETVGVEVPGD